MFLVGFKSRGIVAFSPHNVSLKDSDSSSVHLDFVNDLFILKFFIL